MGAVLWRQGFRRQYGRRPPPRRLRRRHRFRAPRRPPPPPAPPPGSGGDSEGARKTLDGVVGGDPEAARVRGVLRRRDGRVRHLPRRDGRGGARARGALLRPRVPRAVRGRVAAREVDVSDLPDRLASLAGGGGALKEPKKKGVTAVFWIDDRRSES